MISEKAGKLLLAASLAVLGSVAAAPYARALHVPSGAEVRVVGGYTFVHSRTGKYRVIDASDLRKRGLNRKLVCVQGKFDEFDERTQMFSLIGSARLNDVEPFVYLRDIFTRMPATPISQIDQFLPDRWTGHGS